MQYFNVIDDLEPFDLEPELTKLIGSQAVAWSKDSQICLNCTNENSSDYTEGVGSLLLDWKNKTKEVDNAGNEKIIVPEIKNPKKEEDFQYLCATFKGTLFEQAYNLLLTKYKVGRVRLMKSSSKTCLSWHNDYHKRIHLPIKTQQGCFMVIEDEVCYLEKGYWWDTNTLLPHTAVNASKEDRIHLVATIINEH